MKALILMLTLCTSTWAESDLRQMVARFEGLTGTGYVTKADFENQNKGECFLQVDDGKTYSTFWLKFKRDYGYFVFSNMIDNIKEKRGETVVTYQATEDFGGQICGKWAPAKKVVSRMILSETAITLERTYRCPYFIFKSTDRWTCKF